MTKLILFLTLTSLFGQPLTFSRFNDFAVVRLSTKVLRWGPTCNATTPCTVQIGDIVTSFTSPITLTLATGTTGTVRMFVSNTGVRTVLVDGITVTGNTSATGTSFPPGSIMRYSWGVTGGNWAATGTDSRSIASVSGIQVICSAIGATNDTTSFVDLGACTIPANFLYIGDRLEIEATYLHTGTDGTPELDVLAGSLTVAGRGLALTDDVFALRTTIGISSTTAGWWTQTYSSTGVTVNNVGQGSFTNGSAFNLRLRGRMTTSTADTIRLLNFSVRRMQQQ